MAVYLSAVLKMSIMLSTLVMGEPLVFVGMGTGVMSSAADTVFMALPEVFVVFTSERRVETGKGAKLRTKKRKALIRVPS